MAKELEQVDGQTEVGTPEQQFSYEQLSGIASQLQQQAQALAMENQKLREIVRSTEFNELIARTDLLIKIVKNRKSFYDQEFCMKCEQAIIKTFAEPKDEIVGDCESPCENA